MSQEEPKAEAVGKHVAGRLPATARWSPSPGCVRNPWGPSDIMIAGIPSRSIARVCQKSAPRHSDAFSSKVSWRTSEATSKGVVTAAFSVLNAGSA